MSLNQPGATYKATYTESGPYSGHSSYESDTYTKAAKKRKEKEKDHQRRLP